MIAISRSGVASRRALHMISGILLLTLIGCSRAEDDAEAAPSASVDAEVAAVAVGPFTESLEVIGSVVPRSGASAVLSAPGAGRVASVLVTPGERVTNGQSLVTLEASPFEAAARSATASLTTAQRARDRAARLVSEGIAPPRELEQAEADLARARLDSTVAARALELATLRAPFAGVVTRVSATIGSTVDVSQPLVELVNPNALDVVLHVAPAEAGRVRVGAAVTLERGHGADTVPVAQAEVAEVGGTVDSASGTVGVRVRLPTDPSIRIGETLLARIALGTRTRALTIPPEALVPDGDGYKVWVVDSAGVAHGTPVTVGGRSTDAVEITSGLTPGARVVTRGAFGVDDGAHITSTRDRGAASR